MDPSMLGAIAVAGAAIVVTFSLSKFVSKFASRKLGWDDLAYEYPVKKQYLGDWTRRQSFYIRDVFLIDCMNVGANDEALYFEFTFPMEGFQSAQVPWTAVTSSVKRGKTIELIIHDVKLRIRQSSFNAVALSHLLKD